MDCRGMYKELIVSLSILSLICSGSTDSYTSMTVITEGCFKKDMLKDDLKDNTDGCFHFCGLTSHECLRVPESYSLGEKTKVNASYCKQGGNETNYVEVYRVSNISSPKGDEVGVANDGTYKVDYCRQVAGSLNLFHDIITQHEIGETKFYTLCDIPSQEQPAIINISYNKWCDAQAYCIERHGGYLAKGFQAKQCEEVKNVLKDKYSTAAFWTGERTYREYETNNGHTIDNESTTGTSENKNTGTSEREERLWWIILLVSILAVVLVLTALCLTIYLKRKGKEMTHTNALEGNRRQQTQLLEYIGTAVGNASNVSAKKLSGPKKLDRSPDTEDTLIFDFHPLSDESSIEEAVNLKCVNEK